MTPEKLDLTTDEHGSTQIKTIQNPLDWITGYTGFEKLMIFNPVNPVILSTAFLS